MVVTTAAHAADVHWAFVPPVMPPVPAVQDAAWCRTPVDHFIRLRLEQAGLTPAAKAGKRALIRRLTYDLTGLPPTPADVAAFLADDSPIAYERVVDRLLASPHYGERWGRFWLDVARYADSNGQDENYAMANAWRYRDWVVRAINEDLPYNTFLSRQLAGDLLAASPGLSEHERLDCHIATGYLTIGPKMLAEQDKEKLVVDVVDEQLDTIGRGTMGISLSCARCHDHKFDPISQRDYYAMAGILKSTKTMGNLDFVSVWNESQVATREALQAIAAHTKAEKENIAAITATTDAANNALRDRLRAEAARYLFHAERLLAAHDGSGLKPEAVQQRADDNGLQRPTLQQWLDTLKDQSALPQHESPSAADKWLEDLGAAATGSSRRPGRLGAALHCADRQVVDVPHRPELEPGQLTLEAWIRVAEFPKANGDSRRWIINKNANEWARGHYALVLNGDTVGAYINPEGGKENTIAAFSKSGLLTRNRWHHLAMTYDGAHLLVFLDGKEAARQDGGRPRQPDKTSLRIGGRQDGYIYYDGDIDEAAIYSRVLTADEIGSRSSAPENVPPAGLIQRWDFEPVSDAEKLAFANGRLFEMLYGEGGFASPPKDPRPQWTDIEREQLSALETARDALKKNKPEPAAMTPAAAEGKIESLPVFNRGDHLQRSGDPVPRGFPTFLTNAGSPQVPDGTSGRRQLADWLTDPQHPLTARVLVNRVWQAHFGYGLVRSADNFGTTGTPPTHPQLLDWLAVQFVQDGWSLKKLHRLLVTSSVYQTEVQPDTDEDPENRLLAHANRRRLEAEMVRDAMLAVAGTLDLTVGGTLSNMENAKYVPKSTFSDDTTRRSLYLPVIRDRGYEPFEIFDIANSAVSCSRRQSSVVAPQALFFLNSELARTQAGAFAQSLLALQLPDDERLRLAGERALARPPTDAERDRYLHYLAAHADQPVPGEKDPILSAWTDICQVLFAANEFIYLD